MIETAIASLPPNVDVLAAFPSWITQYCTSDWAVLDVGAGRGKNGEAAIIRQKVRRLVGIDPDAGILKNLHVDERYQTSVEAFARERSACFDCIYATFVLEHVAHPQWFLTACRSLLKPGGMLFGATPNLWHYFGIATKMSSCLGIEDWLLEHLIGAQHKQSYHFPVQYRVNSVRRIRRELADAEFSAVEFRCFDHPHEFEYVFPAALRWFPTLYSQLVYATRRPELMGLLMFRATV